MNTAALDNARTKIQALKRALRSAHAALEEERREHQLVRDYFWKTLGEYFELEEILKKYGFEHLVEERKSKRRLKVLPGGKAS